MRIGAIYNESGSCKFIVWAPFLKKVELVLESDKGRLVSMKKNSEGYWETVVNDISPEAKYNFLLNGKTKRPDPASQYQAEGVHGPSTVVDHHSFKWKDMGWKGIGLASLIQYELHPGVFTPEGTFDAIATRIGELIDLGINTIEIMPVAQFPGERNWGYDGVYPFAVQDSYGGPEGLKRLVNECHKKGVAVVLDVVYNHFGPEGNYSGEYGPYFSNRYKTPWGKAINFDDAYSDGVRNYFKENAVYWFRNYHIDALRLDAIHGIFDMSAKPFLRELSEKAEEFSSSNGRKYYLIAESDLNDSKVIRPRVVRGLGMDAQWSDDFHHCLHTLLTGEKQGYYEDFGTTGCMAKALKEGFVYSGEYSKYRKRRHGDPSADLPADKYVVSIQNHDQVGNRLGGERLSSLVGFDGLKLAAGVLILSPYIPMIFMGEEYGEDAPFLYFTSHGDSDLIEAVRSGRKEEFRAFNWDGEIPDSQDERTFQRSKLKWEKRAEGRNKILLDFYKALIKLRKENPLLYAPDRKDIEIGVLESSKFLYIFRGGEERVLLSVFNFSARKIELKADFVKGKYRKLITSDDKNWDGPGSLLPDVLSAGKDIEMGPFSFGLFKQELS